MISITKDTLRQLNAAVGKLDVDTGEIFAGFVGRLHVNDSLYHGDLRWVEAGEDPPKDTVSVKSLLAPSKPKPPSKSKPKPPSDAGGDIGDKPDGDPHD